MQVRLNSTLLPGNSSGDQVRRLYDRPEVLSYLDRDPLYTATLLHEVAERWYERTEWYLWQQAPAAGGLGEDGRWALCRLLREWWPEGIFLFGAAQGVAQLLDTITLPREAYIVGELPHLPAVQAHYRLRRQQTMRRMHLTAQGFRQAEGRTSRLGLGHLPYLNRLYRDYMGATLTARHLEQGIYYGVWHGAQLVAAAGTHLILPHYSLGAVGNVFTHSEHRSRGYATWCTSAVSRELLKRCQEVILSVDATNVPALRVYTRLGYREHCSYLEAAGSLRPLGPWQRAQRWVGWA